MQFWDIISIINLIDFDKLMQNGVVDSSNILPLIGFAWYEIFMLVSMILGVVIIIKNRRQFRISAGLIQLPEGRRAACVMFNSGVIAATVLFGFSLIESLLYF